MFEGNAAQLATFMRGRLVHQGTRVPTGVSIDSRTVQPGDIFFAIKGDRFDGHAFIGNAVNSGASTIVAAQPRPAGTDPGCHWIDVPDPLVALQDLARAARKQHAARFIGITGSNGKTTTKELTAALLGTRHPTWATQGNLNNHIGLPLSLLRLPAETRAAVIEMGMSARGEIEFLAGIAKPQIGVITNVGPAHLEHLGSLENIAAAKGELLQALPADGCAVLNADDTYYRLLRGLAPATATVRTFAFGGDADLVAEELSVLPDGLSIALRHQGRERAKLRLPLLGRHNAANAMAALLVYLHLGGTFVDGIEHLSRVRPINSRMEPVAIDGMRLIQDCYNANPSSMQTAVHFLGVCTGRRIAVLGDMRELGPTSPSLHEKLGQQVAEAKIDMLVVAGELAQHIAQGALAAGMPAAQVHACRDAQEAARVLRLELRAHDTILVKASRGMHFETIITAVWPALKPDLH